MPQTINNMVQEWTNALTTYTAIKMNIPTDVSAAGSLLMDLQVGGSSRFSISKAGYLNLGSNGGIFLYADVANNISFGKSTDYIRLGNNKLYIVCSNAGVGQVRNTGFVVANSGAFSFTNGDYDSLADAFLTRRAAANLRLGAADAAGSAIAINSVATNQLTLASNHGLTTGAAVIITGTAAPSGTSLNTRYYARVIAAAVIELYSTYDQATAASGTTGIIAVTTVGTSASVRLAAPFQSFGVQDFTGTDIPGQPFVIRGSRGTGTGPGGDIVFQVAPAGSSGTAQNALATALTIDSTRLATFAGNLSVPVGSFICTPNLLVGSGATAGLYLAGGDLRLYVDAATAKMAINSSETAIKAASTFAFSWTSASDASGTPDVLLRRDNTGILALRNGANAQTFRVYNTWTSFGTGTEIWERGKFAWESNVLTIGTEKGANGGTARALEFQTNGTTRLTLGATGDIFTQPSTGVYVHIRATASTSASLNCPADGVLLLTNWNINDFNRLQFGGTTSSFPAIKRSSTTLQARLADDSAFAPVQGKLTTDTAYTAGDPTTTGYLVVYDSTGTAYKIPAVAV